MYSRIQYISQGLTAEQQFRNVQRVLERGIDWIQLRWKQADPVALRHLAQKVMTLKEQYTFTLIINDHPGIAAAVGADGVHLGLSDTSIAEARTLLGSDKIIGGTANTLADVQQRIKESCDYIGLGPFRFTETKAVLSPVLGAAGYLEIMQALKPLPAHPPVYAIGGITLPDLALLKSTGIQGIALSGALTRDTGLGEIITQFKNEMI